MQKNKKLTDTQKPNKLIEENTDINLHCLRPRNTLNSRREHMAAKLQLNRNILSIRRFYSQ